MGQIRIVAGEWGGRRIATPGGDTRPTADRVREAWMSIVHPLLDDARVLDACAGSGALGLEALSRGAAHATFVEQNARVVRTLRENIALADAEARATVIRGDALRFVAGLDALAFDVAFADPPYASPLARALAEQWLVVPFARVFSVEHAARDVMPGDATGAGRADTRRYGDSAITFYRVSDPGR